MEEARESENAGLQIGDIHDTGMEGGCYQVLGVSRNIEKVK